MGGQAVVLRGVEDRVENGGAEAPDWRMVRTTAIVADPEQPRKDLGDLAPLKASIAEYGLLQPIIVQEDGAQYRLIAGERRFRASQALGLKKIPVVVRSVEEQARLEIQIIENLHRKDLNPIEEARAYRRLADEFGLSQRQLAQKLGKSPAYVNETLRLLDLPEDLLEAVRTREHISRSILREAAKADSREKQEAILLSAGSEKVTARSARARRLGLPREVKRVIAVKHGTVTVRLSNPGESSTLHYAAALEEALDKLEETAELY